MTDELINRLLSPEESKKVHSFLKRHPFYGCLTPDQETTLENYLRTMDRELFYIGLMHCGFGVNKACLEHTLCRDYPVKGISDLFHYLCAQQISLDGPLEKAVLRDFLLRLFLEQYDLILYDRDGGIGWSTGRLWSGEEAAQMTKSLRGHIIQALDQYPVETEGPCSKDDDQYQNKPLIAKLAKLIEQELPIDHTEVLILHALGCDPDEIADIFHMEHAAGIIHFYKSHYFPHRLGLPRGHQITNKTFLHAVLGISKRYTQLIHTLAAMLTHR